jgi:hypothetical protein
VRAAYLKRHHLANPLPAESWIARLSGAGFAVREHVPLLGEVTARAFLGLDEAWHLSGPDGNGDELGRDLEAFLENRPSFPSAFRHVLRGLLEMEADGDAACGAVFVAEKPSPDR